MTRASRRYKKEPPIYPVQLRDVNEAQFVVKQVTYPVEDPSGVTGGFVCSWRDIDVSLEEAAQLSTAVAWNEDAGYYEPYVARQSYTQFEWGASGYGITFLIDLANNVSADLVTLGLGYAVGRMRGGKGRPRDLPLESEPETLAVEARRAVVAVFDEDFDRVVVDAATLGAEPSRIELHGQRGKYRATFGNLETGDLFTRVVRIHEETDAVD